MRITQNIYFASTQSYVQEGLSRIFEINRDIGTGVRIHRPSDDPAGTERLLSYNRRLSDLSQFSANAVQGRSFVDTSATTLESVNDILSSAREAILKAKNGVIDDSIRGTLIDELTGHIEDIVGLANTRVGNRYLYAGTASDTQPFRLETNSSGRDIVRYFGNHDRINAQIGPNTVGALNIPGSEVFAAGQRGATRYEGLTGAAAGLGSDNGVGVDRLDVYHVDTVVGGASGLATGSDSAALDTVIGPLGSHSISIQVDPGGQSGTISLNDGEKIPFQNPQTNLLLEGPDGEVVYLDTTGVVGGFSGTIPLTATGETSIDGGATRVPIDFSSNQQLRDQGRDLVLNVDTSNIRRAGHETVSYEGTFDVFSSLIAIRDALFEAGENDDVSNDNKRLNDLIEQFDQSADRVLSALGRLGTLSNRLESAESRLDELSVRLSGLKSDVEDTDFAVATSELRASETSYQAALLLTARVGELSLLNFL
ncbi:MAG: flagellar hook-associated protein FlgL [Planctomycetota bacterium]